MWPPRRPIPTGRRECRATAPRAAAPRLARARCSAPSRLAPDAARPAAEATGLAVRETSSPGHPKVERSGHHTGSSPEKRLFRGRSCGCCRRQPTKDKHQGQDHQHSCAITVKAIWSWWSIGRILTDGRARVWRVNGGVDSGRFGRARRVRAAPGRCGWWVIFVAQISEAGDFGQSRLVVLERPFYY